MQLEYQRQFKTDLLLCILQIKFNFLKFFSSFIQIKNLLYTNP